MLVFEVAKSMSMTGGWDGGDDDGNDCDGGCSRTQYYY